MNAVKSPVSLNEQERMQIALFCHKAKKQNPDMAWQKILRQARETLPKDRRYGESINAVHHLGWLQPLLDQLTKLDGEKSQRPQQTLKLTEEEKKRFAKLCYEDRQANPNKTWTDTIRSVRLMFPEDRRIGSTICNPSQINWLMPCMDAIANAQPLPVTNTRFKMTEEDRREFAKICYEDRKANPTKPWKQILNAARNRFPADSVISDTMHSVHQSTWLPGYIEECAKADKEKKAKPVQAIAHIIDGRQRLQTHADQRPAKVKAEKKKTKTFLDHDEKLIFATEVFKIQKNFPGIEWSFVLKKANEKLPVDRRTGKFPSQKSIPWLPVYLKMAEKQLAEEAARPVIPEPIAAPAPAVPAGNPLVDAMAKMVHSMMNEALAKVVATLPAQAAGMVSGSGTEVPQVKREKVLIVGLLSDQGREIQREFGHRFDLKIFDSNVTADKIKANVAFSDHCILMTKFVSHSTQNAMRQSPGFIFCNGTIVALKDQLARLVQKGN